MFHSNKVANWDLNTGSQASESFFWISFRSINKPRRQACTMKAETELLGTQPHAQGGKRWEQSSVCLTSPVLNPPPEAASFMSYCP